MSIATLHLDPSSSMAISMAAARRVAILSASPLCRRRLASSKAPLDGASPLQRFRSGRPLAVTDLTATGMFKSSVSILQHMEYYYGEWCEKQKEFVLFHGKPKRTKAMIAGCKRHKQLEKVLETVKVHTKTNEEYWAVQLMNFKVRAEKLLFDGLTREVPVIGVINGIWISGIIDELHKSKDGATLSPILVDTKTRNKAKVPAEAQKRNARFQLMCYKYLWDSLVNDPFPADDFLEHLNLNLKLVLAGDIKKYFASLGLDVETFGDVFTYFLGRCRLLPPSQEQLLLRYELQSDNSILEEYYFSYDSDWLKKQTEYYLKFWSGEREASFVTSEETWKCEFCAFNKLCPGK